MQIFTESSSDLWKKFSAPEFSFQKTFIYPTETFYALGCRADCNDAIEKIYRLKKREKNKPLLVLVDSWQMLNKYADIKDINSEAIERLLKIIGKGNCTVVLPTRNSLSSQLNFKEKNLGFRITSHPLAKELIAAIQMPLVATSANISGQPAVKNWRNLSFLIKDSVDFILDDQDTRGDKPSSLWDLSDYPNISILREGKFSTKSLKEIIYKYHFPLRVK